MRNLPPSSDREHIQMFFEYEKGQGGGAVSHVTLDEANNFAIVEFEETKGKYARIFLTNFIEDRK